MDAIALKILGGVALGMAGLVGWRVTRKQPPTLRGAPRPRGGPPPASTPSRHKADLALTLYQGRLRAIQERCRFSTPSFERDCLGVVRRVVTQSRYAAPTPGGVTWPEPNAAMRLLLEQTYHAMGHRQAMLLPPGAAPEDIEPRSYRWTFGLFVASMLSELRWTNAWAVSMASPAPGETPDLVDELRRSLMHWMEPEALQWLCEDDLLVRQLHAFFAAQSGASVFHRLLEKGRKTMLGATVATPESPLNGNLPVKPPHREMRPPATTAEPVLARDAAPAPEKSVASEKLLDESPRMVMPPPPPVAEPVPSEDAELAFEHPRSMARQLATAAAEDVAEPVGADRAPVALPSHDHHTPAGSVAAAVMPLLSGAPLAKDFMRWLAGGIAAQTIPSNAVGARVHFVSDGMVLVAPGIFQEYAATQGDGVTTDIPTFGKEVQKAVCAEGWHLRGPQNASVHRFQFSRSGETNAPAIVKGVVIQSPQRFIGPTPAPNPALSRLM